MEATLLGAVVFLLLCAGLIIPLEVWFSRTGVRPKARTMALCASLFIGNTLLMELIGAPVLRALNTGGAAPSLLRIVAVFFLADLCGYLFHRASHKVPLLWRFHKVHHADVPLNWLEGWRQHPVDFILHGISVGLPGALLGASLSDIVLVVLVRKAWTSFLHADVTLRFGIFEWIIATPEFHRVHHSSDPRDFDKNFAGTLPLWDVVFGTASLSPTSREAPASPSLGPTS